MATTAELMGRILEVAASPAEQDKRLARLGSVMDAILGELGDLPESERSRIQRELRKLCEHQADADRTHGQPHLAELMKTAARRLAVTT